MKMCLVLLLIYLLWDGRPGLTRAHTTTEGGDITVRCWFNAYKKWKVFCKNDCNKRENILIQTSDYRQQSGRYSIEYTQHNSNSHILSVSIRNVSRSDLGRYSCGLEKSIGVIESTNEHQNFFIHVTIAVPPRPAVTTVFYKVTTTSRPTEHQQLSTAAPSATPSPSEHQQELTLSGASPLLWLLLIPVVMVMTSVLILLICKKKRTQNVNSRGSRTETELYENLRPDCIYQNIPTWSKTKPTAP